MTDYEGQNFVAITVDKLQPVDSAKTRARLYPFVVLCDPSGSGAWSKYRITGAIPTNYVIDANDTVRYAAEGYNDAAVRIKIDAYLAGVSETHTQPIEFTAVGANPVVGHSAVRFSLPKAANVTLRVYSTSGALVRTLVNGQMPSGANTVNWDLQDNGGRSVGNGLYLYELNTGSQVAHIKVSVLK